jgi:hypothetical protein
VQREACACSLAATIHGDRVEHCEAVKNTRGAEQWCRTAHWFWYVHNGKPIERRALAVSNPFWLYGKGEEAEPPECIKHRGSLTVCSALVKGTVRGPTHGTFLSLQLVSASEYGAAISESWGWQPAKDGHFRMYLEGSQERGKQLALEYRIFVKHDGVRCSATQNVAAIVPEAPILIAARELAEWEARVHHAKEEHNERLAVVEEANGPSPKLTPQSVHLTLRCT